MARQDPSARRKAIVDAAAELIAEVGPAKITHRLVASRAGVPLGSTTAYFASIDELRQAALAVHIEEIDTELADIRAEFEIDPATAPERLVDSLHDYLSDHRYVALAVALNSSATFDSGSRELAERWSDGLIEVLTSHVGADSALAIALIFDGALTYAAVRRESPTKAILHHSFAPFLTHPEA